MKTRFWFHEEKCVACYACRIACMDQNDTEPGEPPPRAVYTREGEADGRARIFGVSRACLHCESPACVSACPQGCLQTDAETGMVLSDSALCMGCKSCAAACPHDAVFFGTDGKIVKCDGCAARVRQGLEPACTRVCPTGAIGLRAEE